MKPAKERFSNYSREHLYEHLEYWERLNGKAWLRVRAAERELRGLRANIQMSLDVQKKRQVSQEDMEEGDLKALVDCWDNIMKEDD